MDYINIAGNECELDVDFRSDRNKEVKIIIEVSVPNDDLEEFAEQMSNVIERYGV